MEKTAISVQIYNETYVLRTSAPQTQVLQVAQSVDERMKRLAADKKVTNREKLAVWTALDLAAELQELQQRYDKLLAAVHER
ncbi:MAG: cell division protein ZapA [Phascolarctobacterium sp.]|nr:cell division protein ZapA [Phascolarctobacterium sp.]MEE1229573.1 cell division protein ZapA [Phascolarctobacterium sp.]